MRRAPRAPVSNRNWAAKALHSPFLVDVLVLNHPLDALTMIASFIFPSISSLAQQTPYLIQNEEVDI